MDYEENLDHQDTSVLPEEIETLIMTKVASLRARKTTVKEDASVVNAQRAAAMRLDYMERINKVRMHCPNASTAEVNSIVLNTWNEKKISVYEHIARWNAIQVDLKVRELERQRDRHRDRELDKDDFIKTLQQQQVAIVQELHKLTTSVTSLTDKVLSIAAPTEIPSLPSETQQKFNS
jgi:hypothetical protein